jgi:N-carbamoylputrescine amidase
MGTFTVGLVQSHCGADNTDNLRRARASVKEAVSRGAQIVCLQELFNLPYFCTVEDTARFALAEDIPGPTVVGMQSLAKSLEVVLIVPLFERRDAGVYHNSAAVIDADGSLLGVYRKMHIPEDPLYYEKFYFTPGDADSRTCGYCVFKTRYADIGVLICWDQWYPEAARITSLLGAQVLFYPTAIGWHPAEKEKYGQAQLSAWQTIQRAHAIANGVYVAAVNRAGHEQTPGTDGIEFFGHSFISDPFGTIVAEAPNSDDTILVAKCDGAYVEEVRQLWPFYRDRRVDSYDPISKRWLGDKSQ